MYSPRSPTDSWQEEEVDSQVAGHDVIQLLGARPSYAMGQPQHQRSNTEDLRRPALTQLRSRSNTSTSTSNSMPLGGRMTSPVASLPKSSPRTSIDRSSSTFSTYSRGERPESLGKALMKKGSKLLRRKDSASELTSLRPLDWSEELKDEEYKPRHSKGQPKTGHNRMLSEGNESSTRWNISEPFDFQHLTHTEPVQFQKMQQARHNDFISEFSAMRASQAPQRQLRGIRAHDIHHNNLYYGYDSPATSPRPQTAGAISPSSSRSQSLSDGPVYNAFSPIVNLNHSEILETCAQMSASHHVDSVDPSALPTPPPRRSSSRLSPLSLPRNFNCYHKAVDSDDEDHDFGLHYDYPIARWNGANYDFVVPHAMTTPDDAACMLRPPPYQVMKTELEQVLEEEECSEGKRSSTATLVMRPTTPTHRHTKSFPSVSSSNQISPEYIPPVPIIERGSPTKKRRVSSQVLPFIERDYDNMPMRPRVPRQDSANKDADADANWEDLIDWCYDQSAEADCDFDFTRASMPVEKAASPFSSVLSQNGRDTAPMSPLAEGPEPHDGQIDIKRPTSSIYSSQRPASSTYSSAPQSPAHNQATVPQSEPTSAGSAQCSFDSSPEAVTPCLETSSDLRSSYHVTNAKTVYSDMTGPASILIPQEVGLQEMDEDLYQEHFGPDLVSNAPFPYNIGHLEGSTVSSISARSSRSPISKSSSQESFWTRHRASNSAGSLPDLIPSKSRSENVNSVVLDQLADQISALHTTDAAADSQHSTGHRRRSSTLAKDIAVKSMLSRVMTAHPSQEEAEILLPIHPAFRDRAGTEAAFRDPDYSVSPLARPVTQRLRSASSASSLKPSLKSSSLPVSRASYGLFPKTGIRTSTIEATFPGR